MQQRRRGLWLAILALIVLILMYVVYLSGGSTAGNTLPVVAVAPSSPLTPPEPNRSQPEEVPQETTTTTTTTAPHPSPWVERKVTRTLVVAKLQEEDTLWVDSLVQDDDHLISAVYVVDNNSSAPWTVPLNKGHEVMVYLTYIIDHWHNNDFLDSDSAKMVRRLRSEHVLQNGYMNLRCHLDPGCPDHIHPYMGEHSEDIENVPEAAVTGMAWLQLFPDSPLPTVLSQPCCAQFAVSADQIRKTPQERYLGFRHWLLATALNDRLSGRVWEYIWQWLFTGQSEFCPAETTCYCEGYGICFDPREYQRYFEIRDEARKLEGEVRELEETEPDITTERRITELKTKIDELHGKMNAIKANTKGIER
ncbi:hypothetical protein BDV26DRAFT_276876 [Aspergillus bertholletiae]|uniref:Uncharacterized protein n=1 Tax=Aspergillus bertholletiae TaxID=1226010 RepID=A0A5N7AME5_9EURO|nr:hypothetical protein BDV26DRAFT_276876 [Aspergillus bertholletiae]